MPKLKDPARARREPQLAVLSVMAHGRGDVGDATEIGTAAARAVLRLPQEQRMLYSLLIEANLSEAARKAIAMEPELVNFFSEAQRRNFERGQAQGEARGLAKGRAASLLKILAQRRLTLSAAQRNRILACTDVAMLERWLVRSLSVSSIEELLEATVKRARGTRRRGRPAAANGRPKRR